MRETDRREKTVRGIVTLVQESRFQLRSEDGSNRLFVLAHDAPLEPQDLPDLICAGRPVEVRYVEARDLLACVARDIGHFDPREHDR